MKKILSIALVAMMMLLLVACDVPQMEHENKLFCVYRGAGFNIYVDVDTRVQYIYSVNHGGMTIRVDENGNPLLYEGELPNDTPETAE
jgi:hypothetical protein